MQEPPKPHGAILAIEDDPHQMELLRLSIGSLPVVVPMLMATDGWLALQQIRQIPSNQFASLITMVLLDLRLPRINGMELLGRASEMGLTERTPFIVFTSSDSAAERALALSLGARDYLVKPLGFRPLQAQIATLYRRWIQTREHAS